MVEDELKQINGMMMIDNLINEVIIEEEVVDEDFVEIKIMKFEKKVIFLDDVFMKGSYENLDYVSLILDVNNIVVSEIKKLNDERYLFFKEVYKMFGKEKIGMNLRKFGFSEIKLNESEKLFFEKVE